MIRRLDTRLIQPHKSMEHNPSPMPKRLYDWIQWGQHRLIFQLLMNQMPLNEMTAINTHKTNQLLDIVRIREIENQFHPIFFSKPRSLNRKPITDHQLWQFLLPLKILPKHAKLQRKHLIMRQGDYLPLIFYCKVRPNANDLQQGEILH